MGTVRRLTLFGLVAMATMTAACASGRAVPRPFPGATAPSPTPVEPSPPAPVAEVPAQPREPVRETEIVTDLVATAMTFRGTPYRNGGSDPSGFDCSGFVQWVFAQHGRGLPREVHEQFKLGTVVDRDQIRAGDLVFFETVAHGASHVGIALGGDRFIHAPSSRGVVRIESYTVEYWAKRYVGARRIGTTDVTTQ